MWKIPSVKQLQEAGANFGHKTTKRHPKMIPFISKVQSTVHLIDLEKTREKLKKALEFVENLAKNNKIILFVGTKPTAQETVKKYALDCGAPYVVNKWIAGTLTNFETINQLIKKFLRMEAEKTKGEWDKYSKKEALDLNRELARLEKMVGGIKTLEKIPDAIYIVDVIKEKTCLREALRKKIPTIAIVDTNGNPDLITYPIPANDDARKSIELITSLIAEAIEQGKKKPVKEKEK